MRKNMKLYVVGLAAAVVLAGCSQKADSSSETGVSGSAVSESGSGTAAAGEDSVVLGTYLGVTYTPLSVEVTDSDVENQIQMLLDANPVITEVDRAAEEGDIVNIDYVGMKDGVAFDGGTADGYDLTLGSGTFIDGFEEGLIGSVKGQELSLDLTFPENYPSEDLAGQAVVFDVTVNAVKESNAPELTDEFIVENTDYETISEYRDYLKEELENQAAENALYQKKSDVFMKVVEACEVTVSDETVQAYYDEQYASYEQQAQMFGLDLETMVGYYGMDLAAFESQLMEIAQEGCKQNIIVNAIAEAENITIEDSELEDLAEEFGYESVDAMIDNAGEENVNNYLLTEKVVTFLADNAVAE